jgi:hypothetical protein
MNETKANFVQDELYHKLFEMAIVFGLKNRFRINTRCTAIQ